VKRVELAVEDPSGLHARPAALFVRTAARFRASVSVRNLTRQGQPVDAKSMLAVLGLGVEQGHRVEIEASGQDEGRAIEELSGVVRSGSATAPAVVPTPEKDHAPLICRPDRLRGIAAAPGAAVGPLWRYLPASTTMTAHQSQLPDAAEAAARCAEELRGLAGALRGTGRAAEAEILDAQAEMALDSTLLDAAAEQMAAGSPLALAIEAAAESHAQSLEQLDDDLLRARAADVRDVGARMARHARGEVTAIPDRPSIVVAADLPPSAVAEIPQELILGIGLERGSRTAHSAILARGLGIPAVLGISGLRAALDGFGAGSSDDDIGLDGDTGELYLAPTREEHEALGNRMRAQVELAAKPAGSPLLADGTVVRLLANIARPSDIAQAIASGARGVGLFRTEFLFMGRAQAPSEDEQTEAYREVLAAFGPERPVVIRLADIGGDKAIPYLDLPPEANPFLGVRAIRIAYHDPRLLRTQLRAILRAGALAKVAPHVMAPMVATVADVELVLASVVDARRDLAEEGTPAAGRLVMGVMIEVPSAVYLARELASRVDFFSIGTNDLTQYLFAADRLNPALDALHDALHPAVLRAIAQVVSAADEAAIPTAVCGDLAADPVGALVLLGLGIQELSVEPVAIGRLVRALATASRDQLTELARSALAAVDAPTVRVLAGRILATGDRDIAADKVIAGTAPSDGR
jgi:phosphoenolpyruvate-protein phosphotransferase